tara:strand:- start:70290 stop:75584 length:5295 start_codon:yes stop_codon:yes gene_type:complete
MKKIYNLVLVLLIGVISLISNEANASHLAGADFSYRCLGPNTFEITLNIFRDCQGINLGNTAPVRMVSTCGDTIILSFDLVNPGDTGIDVSQLCNASKYQSKCYGGPLPGMEQFTYRDTVILAPPCDYWNISWTSNARNAAIVNAVPGSFWVPATIYSETDSCNNSPTFNAQPIPYVCQNTIVPYNFGVVETDGDSLVYTLVTPFLTGPNAPINFNTGYTASQPIPGAVLNSTTGQLTFTPTILGNFVVSVRVCEYEYGTGVLKGCVTRDIQFVVIACTNHSPTANGISNFTGAGALVDSLTVEVCVGDRFEFDVYFPDIDTLDTVSLFTNVTTVLPGAITTVTPGNPATIHIDWTTAPGTPPINVFSVTAYDDACPLYGFASNSYKIKVIQSTYAGPDQAVCQGVEWRQLFATGGDTFVWSVLSGSPLDTVATSAGYNATCKNCASPIVSPQTTTTYLVTSNLSSSCYNTDTVTVRAASNFIATAGPDTIICHPDSFALFATGNIPGSFTYRWNQVKLLSDYTSGTPMTLPPVSSSPVYTNYVVTMTSDSGCIKSDTASIIKLPPVPIPTIVPSLPSICTLGDSSQLVLNLGEDFQNTCVLSTNNCNNTGFTKDILLAGPLVTLNNTDTPAPFSNTKASTKQQLLYHANELQALGLSAGLITEIGFFVVQVSGTTTYRNYAIKMGCFTNASLPLTGFMPLTEEVMIPSVVNIHAGWNMLKFTTPYVWDGVSHLLVEICNDNRGFANTSNSIVRTREINTNPFICYAYAKADTASLCPSLLGGVSPSPFRRPDTRFRFCFGLDPTAYNYKWSPGINITDTTIMDPIVFPDTTTTYTVIYTDTFGVCADTASYLMTVMDFQAGPDTIICSGDTIQLSPTNRDNCTNGAPVVYWYTKSGIGLVSVTGITPTVSVTQTTTFYAEYTNFCGCTASDSVTVFVNEMGPPRLTFSEPDCGFSNGAILVQDSGGSAPLTYSLDSGNVFLTDSLFTNLPMGVYSSQVMDSNGCLSPLRTDTLQNRNTAKIDSLHTLDPLCFYSTDGEIEFFIHGGTPPHTFSVDSGLTWTAFNPVTNLGAGTYTVFARDSNLCVSFPETVTLLGKNELFLDTVIYTNLHCNGDSSGTIQISGHGGTGNYTYSIDSANVFTSSNMFNTLHANTYNVFIKDSLGCLTPPFTQVITEPVALTFLNTPVNDTCNNACGGSASTIVSGGTPPYTYSWVKGVNPIGTNNPAISGLCAGTDYQLTVVDSNLCQEITTFVITQPDLLVTTATTTDVSCFGSVDGTITINAVGGVGPYKYSINGGVSYSNSPLFSGLPAGTYAIMVADSGYRCSATTTAVINTPTELVVTTNILSKTVCVSGCTPLIATATGGKGAPYSYIWSSGFDSSNAQTACPSATTVYSVYAVDTAGCTSSPVLITLKLYDSLSVDAGIDQDICPGQSTKLNAIATGGNGRNINYQWTPVTGLSGGFVADPTASPSTSTTYTVKVTDNCETPAATDTVRITVQPLPTMGFYAPDTTIGCEPFDVSLINTSSPVQFAEWTIGTDITAHGYKADITDLLAGVYDVKLRIVTPFGCENELIKSKFITVYPKPTAKFSLDPNQTTVFNTKIQFTDKSIGDIQTWEWDFASLANSTKQNPLYSFPADSGTFPITLKVTTVKFCTDEATEVLRIGGEYNMYVPNSFTPNGDHNNDVFAPRGIGVDPTQYSLLIYDRWGGLVFQSTSLNQPWDGRVQGTAVMAQNGVYVWKIVANDATDKSEGHTYTGTVNLIR